MPTVSHPFRENSPKVRQRRPSPLAVFKAALLALLLLISGLSDSVALAGSQPAPLRIEYAAKSLQPLDRQAITIHGDLTGHSVAISVLDGQGHPYHNAVLRVENGLAQDSFLAGGALGRHTVYVYLDDRLAMEDEQAFSLSAETYIATGNPVYDTLYDRVKSFLSADTTTLDLAGQKVYGYRSPDTSLIWLRDHAHQSKGFKYFETDMTSALDYFARQQRSDGSFLDFVGTNQATGQPEQGRVEVEADLEYLFVEAVYQAWQATGDDAWLFSHLDGMERGLRYSLSNPLRWSPEYGLVKRPFTIDTWDFEFGDPIILPDGTRMHRSRIDDKTKWSIMHGDNTGAYQACMLLARMYDYAGNHAKAEEWRSQAKGLRQRLNALSWNGSFYTHQIHLDPVSLPVDESQQLSLSNAYALNRGTLDHQQAVGVIREYLSRRLNSPSFAEWFGIDPPFPTGYFPGWGNQSGDYVNGGVLPLVGGELAKGAFAEGFEPYGLDILQRYHQMISTTGQSYLWYHRDGNPGVSSQSTLATDGWGSSAMLYAFMEGMVGVEDELKEYESVKISPRWAVTGQNEALAVVKYGASDGYFAYRYQRQQSAISLQYTGSGRQLQLHLLLPEGAGNVARVTASGQDIPFSLDWIEQSAYVNARLESGVGEVEVSWSGSLTPSGAFAAGAFRERWQSGDGAVAQQGFPRTWLWGPQPIQANMEPYSGSPDGKRLVQYFDKSRMEINQPQSDPGDPWYVTNGLLVKEMVSGLVQAGPNEYETRSPANLVVAGDPLEINPRSPTYASFAAVASLTNDHRAEPRIRQTVTATIDKDGRVGDNPALAGRASVAYYSDALGHNIPDVFWQFLNSQEAFDDPAGLSWVYATGYPLTEPYWAKVRVDGVEKEVLVQLFERRVLTYTPDNAPGWQVEMGNVGQHYLRWRY